MTSENGPAEAGAPPPGGAANRAAERILRWIYALVLALSVTSGAWMASYVLLAAVQVALVCLEFATAWIGSPMAKTRVLVHHAAQLIVALVIGVALALRSLVGRRPVVPGWFVAAPPPRRQTIACLMGLAVAGLTTASVVVVWLAIAYAFNKIPGHWGPSLALGPALGIATAVLLQRWQP